MGSYTVIRLRPLLRQRIFIFAMMVALPNAIITCIVKYLQREHGIGNNFGLYQSYYGMFGSVLSLFIAFRASQSYSRFWEGTNAVYQMVADFQDAAGSLVAFSNCSKKPREQIDTFQHVIVRLFSILHVLSLADLSTSGSITGNEAAFSYDLIDPLGLDDVTLLAIRESNTKVDIVFQWLQSVIVAAADSGVVAVPPPILTRSFGELNAGMVAFHSALKLAEVPFPFPYSAAAELALIIHWIWTPVFVASWSNFYHIVFLFSFVQIFMFWSLNFLAAEMENPFSGDMNDLNMKAAHCDFNERLAMLLSPAAKLIPVLSDRARLKLSCTMTKNPSRRVSGSEDVLSLATALLTVQDMEGELADTNCTSELEVISSAPVDSPSSQLATPAVSQQLDGVMTMLTFEVGKLARSVETIEHHLEASATGHHIMQLSATIESLQQFLAKSGRGSSQVFREQTDLSAEDMHAVVEEEILPTFPMANGSHDARISRVEFGSRRSR